MNNLTIQRPHERTTEGYTLARKKMSKVNKGAIMNKKSI